jgi:hypothetical protein
MKRIPLFAVCLLAVSPMLAASKQLTPGVYTVKPCPPAVVCPPLVTCPEAAPCPTCPPSPVTATNAAPPVCLQPLQPVAAGDSDLRLGAAAPVADPPKAVKPWHKDWRAWAAIGGGIVLGAIIEHQYDNDGSSYDHHEGRHGQDEPEPYCFPPGHCRD